LHRLGAAPLGQPKSTVNSLCAGFFTFPRTGTR